MPADELEYGIHGGDYETSIVKAIKPGWVQDQWLVSETPSMTGQKFLTLEGKIRFAWRMADISDSGICGDATQATAGKGSIIQERVTDILAEVFRELSEFEFSDIRAKAEAGAER